MGYDILSNTTQKSWNCHHDWGCFLSLAQAFGWAPERKDFYYIHTDFQKVSDEDAFAMAEALNMAIAYIKDEPVDMTFNADILKTFDATDVPHLCALATLASEGGFTIA
jgi:hypothetical protein